MFGGTCLYLKEKVPYLTISSGTVYSAIAVQIPVHNFNSACIVQFKLQHMLVTVQGATVHGVIQSQYMYE